MISNVYCHFSHSEQCALSDTHKFFCLEEILTICGHHLPMFICSTIVNYITLLGRNTYLLLLLKSCNLFDTVESDDILSFVGDIRLYSSA